MIVVSRDQDWHDFADTSEYLLVINDLRKALEAFHASSKAVAQRALDALRRSSPNEFTRDLRNSLQTRLSEGEYELDARSGFSADLTWHSADAGEVSLGTEAIVISADDSTVTFAAEVTVEIEYSADYQFSIVDSEGDELPVGENFYSQSEQESLDVEITVPREWDGAPPLLDWALDYISLRHHFGEIGPNFDEPKDGPDAY